MGSNFPVGGLVTAGARSVIAGGIALLVAAWLDGCAGSAAAKTDDARSAAVDLALVTPEGRLLALSSLRGRPVLLFVFTTFDAACQFALDPLRAFAAQHPDLQIVGIAVQPNPAQLLELYATSLDIHFPLTYERSEHLLSGQTALGRIETVPTYVLLDGGGYVAATHIGAADAAALDDMLGAL